MVALSIMANLETKEVVARMVVRGGVALFLAAWGGAGPVSAQMVSSKRGIPVEPEMAWAYEFSPLGDAGLPPPELAWIPSGTFAMGNSYSNLFPNEGYPKELPVHEVPVSGFFIGRFEFTNEELAQTLQWAFTNGLVEVGPTVVTNVSGGVTNVVTNLFGTVRNSEGAKRELVSLDSSFCQIAFTNGAFAVAAGKAQFPCVHVSWYGALAVCNYLSDREGLERAVDFGPTNWSVDIDATGYRLPTEAEWEKACRGATVGTHFPWPDDSVQGTNIYLYSSDPCRANYLDARYVTLSNHPGHPWFGESIGTTPVGYYDGAQVITNWSAGISYQGADYGQTNDMANGYGLYDMAGNIHEWCLDYLGTNWYEQPGATQANPTGPTVENSWHAQHVVRGGGWTTYLQNKTWDPSFQRCSVREASFPPQWVDWHIGFRVVRRPTIYEQWALGEGLNPLGENGGGAADYDGDGFSNEAERTTGTQPTNAASFFRATGIGTVTNQVSVAYWGVSGRVYVVEGATNLAATPVWQPLATVTSTATGEVAVPVEAAEPRQYLRIWAKRSP